MVRTLPPPFEQKELHQVNMEKTLEHRADVASVHQDLQLLKLLQKERQQLEAVVPHPANKQNLWAYLKAKFIEQTQISVEKIESPSGQIAWRVYDPQTRRSRYAETSAEVVAWLETNRRL